MPNNYICITIFVKSNKMSRALDDKYHYNDTIGRAKYIIIRNKLYKVEELYKDSVLVTFGDKVYHFY